MLLSATAVVFVVILAIEVTIIIIGNAFTIFVFWNQRLRLKRTFLLLINLAVADVLVGLGEALVLATNTIPNGGNEALKMESPWWAFQVFGSSASLMSLALISLERVYAVLWPLRHRVASTRAYVYSIGIIWVAGLCMSGLLLLTIYHINDSVYVLFTYASFTLLSLLVICASYLMIRSRLQCTAIDLDVQRQASAEKTLRMSRTFFIVIAVSLIFWLPGSVMGFIRDLCACLSPVPAWFVTVLALGNSIANPLVYSFRMPMFQDALKKFWRKRQQNIELRAVAGRSHISNFSLWIRCISGLERHYIVTALKNLSSPITVGFLYQSLLFHPYKHTWQSGGDPNNGIFKLRLWTTKQYHDE